MPVNINDLLKAESLKLESGTNDSDLKGKADELQGSKKLTREELIKLGRSVGSVGAKAKTYNFWDWLFSSRDIVGPS